jgi:transposase InsO family protein
MLARRLGLDRKTVRKWRARSSTDDLPMGPAQRRSSVLSELEEAAVVAVRVQTRLPLDDLYAVMRDTIPHLSRSTLHRALQRHGVSRRPRAPQENVKRFKAYEIGYFHLDICELRTAEGKAYLFVAVDRTSKLVFARLYRKANKLAAQAFLKVLIRTVPYRIHTVLTDNGVQFSDQARTGEHVMVHPFTRLCWANGIEHRLTKPYHPWTNGQAERTVRTIKDATVHAFHYATIWELRRHITDWLAAYNFAKQLKALRWRTPMEAITAVWRQKPDLFHNSPGHYSPGPNITITEAMGRAARHSTIVAGSHRWSAPCHSGMI